QWLGGIGILVLLHSLIPASFEQQSSILSTETEAINTDNISFARRSTAKLIYLFYIAMSGTQVLLLKFCGLNWYDSFIFSFGTSASGGLNNYSDGLLHVANPAAEAVLAVFMLLSCVNFALYVRLLRGETEKVHGNTELNAYVGLAAAGVILVTLDLFIHHVYSDLAESLRFGGFQAISFLTTTGLSNADFNLWPSFSKMVLTILSFIGGCSTSTGGALKVIRVVIISKMVWRSFTTRIHPNAVVTIKTNGKPVPSNIANKAVAYTLIFFVLFLSGTFLLTFDPASDFQSAFTASGAMLCNIGTGAGVMGMFAEYHMFGQFSQLVMCFLMLAGRLEIYALLLPFSGSFWREKI
ncbi:MAG: TrkH family potassium uptake protein, partial [Firmicutes bacterium]|nr:TrkH family potassium uptake protein [Bacillota bacterium]